MMTPKLDRLRLRDDQTSVTTSPGHDTKSQTKACIAVESGDKQEREIRQIEDRNAFLGGCRGELCSREIKFTGRVSHMRGSKSVQTLNSFKVRVA
jgi:hypothetical protein